MSADAIPAYDREFLMSTLRYQYVWDEEADSSGGTAKAVDEIVKGPSYSPAVDMCALEPYRLRGELVLKSRRTWLSVAKGQNFAPAAPGTNGKSMVVYAVSGLTSQEAQKRMAR